MINNVAYKLLSVLLPWLRCIELFCVSMIWPMGGLCVVPFPFKLIGDCYKRKYSQNSFIHTAWCPIKMCSDCETCGLLNHCK